MDVDNLNLWIGVNANENMTRATEIGMKDKEYQIANKWLI